MDDPKTFDELLRHFMDEKAWSIRGLAKRTGITERTIENWREGRVKRPQKPIEILKVASAMHLGEREANALFATANYAATTIASWRERADLEHDRELYELLQPILLIPPPPLTLSDALEKLNDLPLDVIPDIAALPTPNRMRLQRNASFIGRRREVIELAHALTERKAAPIGQTVALIGPGGIGKTDLANEFVQRYGQFFAAGVFWIHFADPANVPLEIVACGGQGAMNLPGFSDLRFNDQVEQVLRAWQSPVPRLLIFDNCDDYEDSEGTTITGEQLLAEWRPATGGCRVILTSRRATWDPTLGVTELALSILPRAESIALLRSRRLSEAVDDTILDAIADELGDLPLALHYAGNYLKRYGRTVTPQHYLSELRNPRLLESSAPQEGKSDLSPTDLSTHVVRTFTLSYEKLDPDKPIDSLAVRLLARAACFAPGEPIPWSLLLTTLSLPGDHPDLVLQVEDALARLTDLGLLEETRNDGALRLHPLLAKFVKSIRDDIDVLAVNETVETTLHRIIRPPYITQGLTLQAHLRSVVDVAIQRQDIKAGSLCNLLGYYLQIIGDFVGAQYYFKHALAIRKEVLGLTHPDTATSLNNLGFVLQEQGQLKAARPYYERALGIRKSVLGADHTDTASSLNNMGYLLQAERDYAVAQPYFEQALAIREKVLGLNHVDTANSLNNLGYVLQEQGKLEEACSYYERALAIRKRLLGKDHPDTANSLNNMGYLLQAQSEFKKAQLYFQEAYEIYERVFGQNHPDTANSLNNIAYALHQRGELEEALPLYKQALAIRERVLGLDHPDTAISLQNLAAIYDEQGLLQEAESLMRRAVQIRAEKLGASHPDTQNSYRWLESIEKRLMQRPPDVKQQLAERVTEFRATVDTVLATGSQDKRMQLEKEIEAEIEYAEEGASPDSPYHEYAAQLCELLKWFRELGGTREVSNFPAK